MADSILTRARPLLAARLAGAVLALAVPMVLARVLLPEAYGTFKQAWLVSQTLALMLPMGLTQSLYYFVPREPRDRDRYVAQTVWAHVVLGLLAAGLVLAGRGLLARHLQNPELDALLGWVAAFSGLLVAGSPLDVAWNAAGRIGAAALARLATEGLRSGALIAGALATGTVRGALVGMTLAAAARAVAGFALLAPRPRARLPARRSSGDQFAYALPFGLAFLLIVPQQQFHQYAVSAAVGAAAFAVYSVGTFQLPVVDVLYTPVSELLQIGLAEADGAGRPRRAGLRLFHEAVLQLSFAFLPLAGLLVVVAPALIELLFSPVYLPAVPLFRLSVVPDRPRGAAARRRDAGARAEPVHAPALRGEARADRAARPRRAGAPRPASARSSGSSPPRRSRAVAMLRRAAAPVRRAARARPPRPRPLAAAGRDGLRDASPPGSRSPRRRGPRSSGSPRPAPRSRSRTSASPGRAAGSPPGGSRSSARAAPARPPARRRSPDVRRAALAAAAALALVTVARLPAAWESGNALNHVSGVWMTLADDLAHGTLYRPLHAGDEYGGTRYFPLAFALHAALLRAGVPLLPAGYAASLAAGVLLVVGSTRSCARSAPAGAPPAAARRRPARRSRSRGFAGQHALAAVRGDLLPVGALRASRSRSSRGVRRAGASRSPRSSSSSPSPRSRPPSPPPRSPRSSSRSGARRARRRRSPRSSRPGRGAVVAATEALSSGRFLAVVGGAAAARRRAAARSSSRRRGSPRSSPSPIPPGSSSSLAALAVLGRVAPRARSRAVRARRPRPAPPPGALGRRGVGGRARRVRDARHRR